jgi:MFS family permease
VTEQGSTASNPTEVLSPWKRPDFVKLLAISVTVALGFGMVVPVLPLYAKSFGVGLAAIGLIQLVFGLTRFSFNLVGGLVVDRYGERACTITGLLVVSLSSYAAGFSQTFPQLVLARGFGGAGSALFIAGLQNRILRIIEPEAMGRATGAFRSSFLVGIGAGPVMGGIVAKHFGLSAPFIFYATGLLLASVIAWFVMTGQTDIGTAPRRSPLEAFRTAKPLFGDIRYVGALLATFVGWWTIAGPAQTIGVVFAREELHFGTDKVGLAITLLSVGEVIALLFVSRAADRYGRRAVLVPSIALAGIAVAAIGQVDAFPWLFFPLMVVCGGTIAAGSIAAGGLLADSIPQGGSGAAVGLNQMAGDLGYLTSPTAIGFLAEHAGYGPAYLVAAIPAGLVFFVMLRLPPGITARREEEPGPVPATAEVELPEPALPSSKGPAGREPWDTVGR